MLSVMNFFACAAEHGPVLPTADVLLAPEEDTLRDLLINGGEKTALAEFGTIQVRHTLSRAFAVQMTTLCCAKRPIAVITDMRLRSSSRAAGVWG